MNVLYKRSRRKQREYMENWVRGKLPTNKYRHHQCPTCSSLRMKGKRCAAIQNAYSGIGEFKGTTDKDCKDYQPVLGVFI